MSLWNPIHFDQETIEEAVALCAGLGNKDVSAYASAVYPLAYDDVEARLDLARVAFREVYKRRTPCWVYFAQVGDALIKVGRSITVEARLASLSRAHAAEHKLIGSVRGDYREEGMLHRHFRNHRVRNLEGGHREYYAAAPIRPTIDAILAAGKMIELPFRAIP